jgi:hypothetical protein
MFSQRQPNFRAECSENCYKNSKFQQCLAIFPHSSDHFKFAFVRMRSMLEAEDVDEGK